MLFFYVLFQFKCTELFFLKMHLPLFHNCNRYPRAVSFLFFFCVAFFSLCYLLPHLKCKRATTGTRIRESRRGTSTSFLCCYAVHGNRRSINYVGKIGVVDRRKKNLHDENHAWYLFFLLRKKNSDNRTSETNGWVVECNTQI